MKVICEPVPEKTIVRETSAETPWKELTDAVEHGACKCEIDINSKCGCTK